jgi:hypothetical protein
MHQGYCNAPSGLQGDLGRLAVTQGGASRRSSLRFALGYAVAAPFGAFFDMECDPKENPV